MLVELFEVKVLDKNTFTTFEWYCYIIDTTREVFQVTFHSLLRGRYLDKGWGEFCVWHVRPPSCLFRHGFSTSFNGSCDGTWRPSGEGKHSCGPCAGAAAVAGRGQPWDGEGMSWQVQLPSLGPGLSFHQNLLAVFLTNVEGSQSRIRSHSHRLSREWRWRRIRITSNTHTHTHTHTHTP